VHKIITHKTGSSMYYYVLHKLTFEVYCQILVQITTTHNLLYINVIVISCLPIISAVSQLPCNFFYTNKIMY